MIKKNYINDLLTRGIIDFKYLASADIPTDPISKPVPASQLQRMINYFSMVKL
jgi:hypothetical protein